VSAELAALLRKSTDTYTARAVEYSRKQFATEPRPEILALHTRYWDTLVRAAETWDFEELVTDARTTGGSQAARGVGLTESVNRAVAATNTIELAILEANDGTFPSHNAIVALAEIRTTIAMAVAEGYERARDNAPSAAPARGGASGSAVSRVRATAAALGVHAIVHDLAIGDALPTTLDDATALCLLEAGDVRLSTRVGGERVVSLFTVGIDGAFFQWNDTGRSRTPIVAEALTTARVLVLQGDALARVTAADPESVVSLIARFTRRTSESQALIDGLIRKSVAMRLYNTLLHLASTGIVHADGSREIGITHQQLAEKIGASRVTITRKLCELRESGIVDMPRDSTIRIRNREALEQRIHTALHDE
jgi:CRP-like cAMP-binding protein